MESDFSHKGYAVRRAEDFVYDALSSLCIDANLPVHPGPPPQSHLFRELYQGHLVRKEVRDYDELEQTVLGFQDHFRILLPGSDMLIPSHDPPALFPLRKGAKVEPHTHEHILSEYVTSLILENPLEDPIWVKGKHSPTATALRLPPGTLLIMAGDCLHWVESVEGRLTVLAFDFERRI